MTDFTDAIDRAISNTRSVVLPDPEPGCKWSGTRKPVNDGQAYWNDHFEAVKIAHACCVSNADLKWYVQEPFGAAPARDQRGGLVQPGA